MANLLLRDLPPMTQPSCQFCQNLLRLSGATTTTQDWTCQACPYYLKFSYDAWPIRDGLRLKSHAAHFKIKDNLIHWIFYQQPTRFIEKNLWSEIIQLKSDPLQSREQLVKFYRPLKIPLDKMEERLLTYLTFL